MIECEQCGDELEWDVPHECLVGGNTVLITRIEEETDEER